MRFSELGGGPLGHTLGCHQNFDISGATLVCDRATQPGDEQISSQPQETIVKSEPLMPEACLGNDFGFLFLDPGSYESSLKIIQAAQDCLFKDCPLKSWPCSKDSLSKDSPTQLGNVKNVQKCQNSDGTLRCCRVVPHPAPQNVEKYFSRIAPEMFPHQF